MNPSEKSCSIVYRVCEQEQVTGTVQENSTGNNNMVVLMLGNLQEATYCYVVTAKNRTFTVNINGRIDLSKYSAFEHYAILSSQLQNTRYVYNIISVYT